MTLCGSNHVRTASLGEWKIYLMRSIDGSKSKKKLTMKMKTKKIVIGVHPALKLLHRVTLINVSQKINPAR